MIFKKSIFSILAIALLITGCKNVEQQKENQQLSSKIQSVLNQRDFDVLDLTTISDKDWDRVCIISPYSLNAHAEKVIGFYWDIQNNAKITVNDGISLLLFIKNNTVVEFVQHPRNIGDFTNIKPECIVRNEAKFVLDSTEKQWNYLIKK
jgi:hypothetical protein